ncbi:hypothetical protein ABV589_10815 [Pseudomonas sp. HOU2]|uniref:hypothetical protein n=1 Tax=Pseudomonas sp. HOU2 TaxID=3230301 RepID=UPI00345AE801
MFLLPMEIVLSRVPVGAAEGCDPLIFTNKDRSLRQRLQRPVFYREEIIGCIVFSSNLKCTSRLVLRAIIEHYGVSAN